MADVVMCWWDVPKDIKPKKDSKLKERYILESNEIDVKKFVLDIATEGREIANKSAKIQEEALKNTVRVV